MTVADLIEELRQWPATARVTIQIRHNVGYEDRLEDLYEFREAAVESVVYSLGRVLVQLDE